MERDIVCRTCNTEFHHVQAGRGRPPKDCPDCRKAKANAPKRPRGRPKKRLTVATTPTESVPIGPEEEKRIVALKGVLKVGDLAVHPLADFKSRESAIRHATPVEVVEIVEDYDRAIVNYHGTLTPTTLSKLVKVEWQTA